MSYLGIDVGTSGCRAAIMNNQGQILHIARRDFELLYPGSGMVEIDPKQVWESVKKVLKDLSGDCRDVKAIAISSIGETMVMLDENDRPLSNGIIYLDQRCQSMINDIEEIFDIERLYIITGLPFRQMHSLCRYMWYQQNCPRILDQAKCILMCSDYIGYLLTGEQAIDPATASKSMFFDISTMDWSNEICDTFGIRRELLSPVRKTGSLLGKIKRSLALELGLDANLKVYLGGHDQCVSTLGGGATQVGEIVSSQGSTEGFNMLIGNNNLARVMELRGSIEPFVIDDQYFTCRGQISHGNCIRWYAHNIENEMYQECLKSGEKIYKRLDDMCAEDCGEVLFFPYLSRVSIRESGLKKGALGGFLGIDTGIDKRMLYRAILEGLSFETRYNFEWLKKIGLIRSIAMVGGGATSPLFMQMKADILDQPLKVLQSAETVIIGLGMICAVATGEFNNYFEAVPSFVHIQGLYVPQKDYSKKYLNYKTISKVIKEVYQII